MLGNPSTSTFSRDVSTDRSISVDDPTPRINRILYITARADIGGGQECLYRLAEETTARAEVFIAAPREEPYWSRFEALLGPRRLIEIPHRKLSLHSARQVTAFVRNNAIDLIHSHGFGAGLYGRLVAIFSGVPAVHTFHGLEFKPSRPLWTATRFLVESALSLASKRLIAVSGSEEKHLKRWLFAYSKRIHKIHNGIPDRTFSPKPLFSSAKPVRILWVGRMHEQKDPFQVVDIANDMRDLLKGELFTIEMVGDGPLKGELEDLIAQSELQDVVLVRSSTNDIGHYYDRCDILLSTSRWEGLPTCILEAMQAGLLVVASSVSGNLDLVEDRCTGVVFDKQSSLQAAELLCSVIRGEVSSSDMLATARKRVASEFGIERFADEHLRLYQSVLWNEGSTEAWVPSATTKPLLPTPDPNSGLRVAVVHDWLTAYAGSERVVEQIMAVFPTADLFALVDFLPEREREFLCRRPVNTSFLQQLPIGRKLFRKLLWLLPLAVESFDLTPYDVIISSSHAVAKGVITGPDQLHICYCHSPIRYAWDLQHEYLREAGLSRGLSGLYARLTLHYMRIWDLRTANGVDRFIANSHFIARRIQKTYRREAAVIHPPIDIQHFQLQTRKENFYITVSRLVPYKRVDLIAAAFAQMPNRKLLVIGDGPNLKLWRQQAAPNVEFLGYQSDETVRTMMGRAKAFVFAAEEDFGITVVEAQASGTPVVCFARGGALESVVAGRTGVFFKHQTAESIRQAVETFERTQNTFDPSQIRAHAAAFSAERFRLQFQEFVLGEAQKRGMIEKSKDARAEFVKGLDEELSVSHVSGLAALGGALIERRSPEQTVVDNSVVHTCEEKERLEML